MTKNYRVFEKLDEIIINFLGDILFDQDVFEGMEYGKIILFDKEELRKYFPEYVTSANIIIGKKPSYYTIKLNLYIDNNNREEAVFVHLKLTREGITIDREKSYIPPYLYDRLKKKIEILEPHIVDRLWYYQQKF